MTMAETETVLLRRFTNTGDAEAFAEITRRYAGLVYGAALRILADVDRASDVAQETFLQLIREADSVSGSLPGWLHRVATHKAIDQVRRDASRRQKEQMYAAQRPQEVCEWKGISPYVDEELNELDPQIREVLILHFLEGRTTRRIAGLQGVSQATVSRRMESGVGQLRAALRRRGIIVALGTLSALLGENAVQAAPPVLLSELGKMALVGGAAAVSAAGASGAAGSLTTAAGGLVAAVKTHAVAVAAVAVISAGTVVTYRQATRPSFRQPVAAPARSTAPSIPRRVSRQSPPPESPPAPVTGRSQAAREWEAMMNAAKNRTVGSTRKAPPPQQGPFLPTVATTVNTEPEPQAQEYAMMGAMVGPAEPPEEPAQEETEPPLVGGFGFAMGSARPPVPPIDPNDPNES
jgi:RNA polymerase sigma-70 factor (ECF subfamily)